MTQLEPGKRYAVTRIGVAHSEDVVVLDSGGLIAIDNPNITVELLPDPLPTTPGSVIRDREDVKYMRLDSSSAYHWVRTDGYTRDDDELEGATVLFDAGADRA